MLITPTDINKMGDLRRNSKAFFIGGTYVALLLLNVNINIMSF